MQLLRAQIYVVSDASWREQVENQTLIWISSTVDCNYSIIWNFVSFPNSIVSMRGYLAATSLVRPLVGPAFSCPQRVKHCECMLGYKLLHECVRSLRLRLQLPFSQQPSFGSSNVHVQTLRWDLRSSTSLSSCHTWDLMHLCLKKHFEMLRQWCTGGMRRKVERNQHHREFIVEYQTFSNTFQTSLVPRNVSYIGEQCTLTPGKRAHSTSAQQTVDSLFRSSYTQIMVRFVIMWINIIACCSFLFLANAFIPNAPAGARYRWLHSELTLCCCNACGQSTTLLQTRRHDHYILQVLHIPEFSAYLCLPAKVLVCFPS